MWVFPKQPCLHIFGNCDKMAMEQRKGGITMSPKMVELHDIDVPAFLKVLDSCEGEV